MLKHKERYKKTIKNLTVMSDIFARNVFKDKKACEYVLRIIMEDKDLTVIAKILKVNAQMVQEWLAGSVSTAR